ncbi:unnamed protein product [Leuciscus chuanchicus]
MESTPNLRVEAGELVLRPSKRAATVEKVHLSQVAKGVPFVPKYPEAVLGEAKVRVIQGGGNPFDDLLVASQSAIQFGQYRGKPFKWIIVNDLGYSLMVLSGHQREREAGRLDRSALMANKDAFLQYACTFEMVAEAIKSAQAERGHVTWLYLEFIRHQYRQQDGCLEKIHFAEGPAEEKKVIFCIPACCPASFAFGFSSSHPKLPFPASHSTRANG